MPEWLVEKLPALVIGAVFGFVIALGIVEWVVSDLRKFRDSENANHLRRP